MPKLLLVSNKLRTGSTWETGDVVGVFPDDHPFTKAETRDFTIITVSDTDIIKPELVVVGGKDYFRDSDGKLKEIVVWPKYASRYDTPSGKCIETYSRYAENLTNSIDG